MSPEPDVNAIWTVCISYAVKQAGPSPLWIVSEDEFLPPDPEQELITREYIDQYTTRFENHFLIVDRTRRGQISHDKQDLARILTQLREGEDAQSDDIARMLRANLADFAPDMRADNKVYTTLLNSIAAHVYMWERDGNRVAVYKENRIMADEVLKQIRVKGSDTEASLFYEAGDTNLPHIPNMSVAQKLITPQVF